MKIAVITMHSVPNYGSVLQALATQEIFKQKQFDLTIIDYIREDMRYKNLVKTWSNGNPLKAVAIIPTIIRWRKVFRKFYKSNLKLTEHEYYSEKDFERYPVIADIYCTGSDQVWNSKWNKGILPEMYLSFVKKEMYKISFCSSFGNEKLSNDEVNCTKDYIQNYNYISVREDSAENILKNQYYYDKVCQLVDPTIALSPEYWRKLKSRRVIDREYILIYNLNRSYEFDKYSTELSKKTGLKLVRLCTRYDQFYRPGKSVLIPEIFDFISLIDDAKYVLTDSFHATAFSMNLNTMPICFYPSEFGGRLESFLNLVDSKQCHVSDYSDFSILEKTVDFDKVNRILNQERKRVSDFIDTIVTEWKESYDDCM